MREITMTELDRLACKIDDMITEFEADALKRTVRDFISGLVSAYGIMAVISDADEAMNAARAHAARVR